MTREKEEDVDKQHDEMLDYFDDRVEAAVAAATPGTPLRVSYSMYDEDDESGLIVDGLDAMAVEGLAVFVYPRDDFFSLRPDGRDFRSRPLRDVTNLGLAVLANMAIDVTGDEHHRFLEGTFFTEEYTADGVPIFALQMGS